MEPIRILHLLHGMNRGGAENAIMNYYRHIDRQLIQFDFLVTADEKCDFDDEILSMGGRIYKIPSLKLSQIFDYIDGDDTVFERQPLETLANKGELMSYIHEGFWQCMDNVRERDMLEKLLKEGKAPWKKWERIVPNK